jgi:Ca2+-transporting ATPase
LTDIDEKPHEEKFGNNEQIHKQNTDGGCFLIFKRADVVVIDRRSIIYFILGQNSEAYFMLAANRRFRISFTKTTAAGR